MNKIKSSVVVHNDSLDVLDLLSDEDCGKLFRAIKSFIRGEDYQLDKHLSIAFLPFKNQFERDKERFLITCERNKINGSKGGQATATNRHRKVATATESKRKAAKVAENDSDSDSDSDSDKENDNDNKKKNKKREYSNATATATHPLQVYIIENYPNVCKMKSQLTENEAERLKNQFSHVDIIDVLNDMENKPDLAKKYSSVNLTIRKWISYRQTDKKIETPFEKLQNL